MREKGGGNEGETQRASREGLTRSGNVDLILGAGRLKLRNQMPQSFLNG